MEGARAVGANDDIYDLEDSHSPAAPRVRRIKAPHLHHPEYARAARHAKIVEVLTDLWGSVRIDTGKLNMKSSPRRFHCDPRCLDRGRNRRAAPGHRRVGSEGGWRQHGSSPGDLRLDEFRARGSGVCQRRPTGGAHAVLLGHEPIGVKIHPRVANCVSGSASDQSENTASCRIAVDHRARPTIRVRAARRVIMTWRHRRSQVRGSNPRTRETARASGAIAICKG